MKFKVGDEGPEEIAMETAREPGKLRVIEPDRGPTDAFREEDSEEGRVGARRGGCCRIRRKPEAPSPCSCSVMTGDLIEGFESAPVTISLARLQRQEEPRDRTLRFLRKHRGKAATTNLDIVSYSAAAKPASKENRILAFSVPFCACARRFPVLRFLGMRSSLGD